MTTAVAQTTDQPTHHPTENRDMTAMPDSCVGFHGGEPRKAKAGVHREQGAV